MDYEKPGSPGDILKHHGVKGQKWGVRKEEDSSATSSAAKAVAGANADTKAYMSAASEMTKNISSEKQAANLKANRERFAAKFEASEATGHKIATPEKPNP